MLALSEKSLRGLKTRFSCRTEVMFVGISVAAIGYSGFIVANSMMTGERVKGMRSAGGKVLHAPIEHRSTQNPSTSFTLRFVQRRPHIVREFMADVANKYEINNGGKYYVDNQCIDCDLCRETAPDNFKRNDDGGYSFVYKQPENDEEEARCKEAKEGCPVEAIGDNGG